ncbi:Threonine/homoserine/homoserine lactone efflux protein [Streptomyces sp. 2224.1]|uniref:LysE family translocator n=1 Tax=unclassified Streptomyces TaxID=2593676 RepID=UPI0008843F34|nr:MULTISPECIES: LysE family translocator [unclassified Streptomyces]PBC84207.1 threonine/homoserine/homoserine lactone efflux protein [Streptomyces sp. 2321.6]SDR33812.1 Threonine/homoserine/homoserine lactone efflux protein [Streptomyces sp. KS_16]SEB78859.1 Threonine/homoserine/homoserine lactone efflux protein [Streptomyces sp. 2224.1]SED23423.1 Threonine/homoserine/homoserine lactone efflux protein [Streptomyces sp. 2133.1]SEE58573.1 Threonine/homoserine/homoserine lactone efflux protein 
MDTTTLAAFLAVDLLLVFTPGADWAYAIGAGLRDRSVVPAVAGLIAGYAGYTLLAVAGLVVIVASSTTLLTALTVAGAGYLVWLGCSVLRQPATLTASGAAMGSSRLQIMLKGAGTSGLNPKALLLYFSLFPQFIDPATGWPIAAQTGLLGTLHMTACAVVYLGVAVLARTVLKTRPSAARAVTRCSGAMMIVIGGLLLVESLTG